MDIFHSGIPHDGSVPHSGRYAWGSGENPFQHENSFRTAVEKYRAMGLSEKDIYTAMGMSSGEYRQRLSISKSEKILADRRRAMKLKEHGYSNTAIGEIMGRNESSIRMLLKEDVEKKASVTQKVADVVKRSVDEKGYIDIGAGVERELGVSKERLRTAVKSLEEEGYTKHYIQIEQVTNPGQKTTITVLAPPGTTTYEIYKNKDKISNIREYSSDDGDTWTKIKPPVSVDSKRIYIRYGDDGGSERDGTIEIRRGVEDLTMGNANYAQARIAVDGTHYLKGMALYSDNVPDGYDIVYNTNKKTGTPKEDVFKSMKDDPENPFGALIKNHGQIEYVGSDGKTHLSAVNKVKEEGDWNEYSKNLASQFLVKQNQQLVSKQLELAYADKLDELETIKSLTNPVLKQSLLQDFSENCDSAAVKLKAAPLPRQTTKVILPVTTLKDNEIFAPTLENGETVALVRYPHGGTFEIPILKVNNKHQDAIDIIGLQSIDAVGINSKVAERLSGADFDGDTVVVIPCNSSRSNVHITSTPQLRGLKDFNPKSYQNLDLPDMKTATKQNEMGKVSNLITDMTLMGATDDEVVRAVKHSMVVIDAEKHHLDYKQSYKDNRIADLKTKYLGAPNNGAATLISRAKSPEYVDQRKINTGLRKYDPKTGKGNVDPKTGKLIFETTGNTYFKPKKVDKNTGEVLEWQTVKSQTKSTKMAETDDARTLLSGENHNGYPKERLYANYANNMKALANQARLEYINIESPKIDISARKTYSAEVQSLNDKLNVALMNAPRERKAQLISSVRMDILKADNPDMTTADKKKESARELTRARAMVGASKTKIDISDREWEAIQAGAISAEKMRLIFNNTDSDKLKQRAMPRKSGTIPASKKARIKAMAASGYSLSEIAEACGVSPSTASKYIKGKE